MDFKSTQSLGVFVWRRGRLERPSKRKVEGFLRGNKQGCYWGLSICCWWGDCVNTKGSGALVLVWLGLALDATKWMRENIFFGARKASWALLKAAWAEREFRLTYLTQFDWVWSIQMWHLELERLRIVWGPCPSAKHRICIQIVPIPNILLIWKSTARTTPFHCHDTIFCQKAGWEDFGDKSIHFPRRHHLWHLPPYSPQSVCSTGGGNAETSRTEGKTKAALAWK